MVSQIMLSVHKIPDDRYRKGAEDVLKHGNIGGWEGSGRTAFQMGVKLRNNVFTALVMKKTCISSRDIT